MKRPKFCGYCGQSLEKYDQNAAFCMNCGKPIIFDQQSQPGMIRPSDSAQYSTPLPHQMDQQAPIIYTPYKRSPYGLSRPFVEYASNMESLKILIGKPHQIHEVFTKTSWISIFVILLGYLFLEFISLQILSSKINFNVTDNFIQELSSLGFGTNFNDLGMDVNTFLGMLITIMPLEIMGFKLIFAFIAGVGVYIMLGFTGVDRGKYNFRIAMTAVTFASVPKLLLGSIEIIFALLYPETEKTLDTMIDLDIFFDPKVVLNNVWLELGVDIAFGIMIAFYLFWGLYKGLKIKRNSAIIVTLLFTVFFTDVFSILINLMLIAIPY
ncbi:MAG: zinc ribbon domain-containing protein [Candidatus Hodarchaeales archaeon]